MNRRLRAVTGGAGVIAILAGIVVATDPGYLADLAFVEGIRGAIGGLEPTLVMLFAGVVLLVGSAISLRQRDGAVTAEGSLQGAGDAGAAGAGRQLVGAEFDRRVDAALAGDAAALADVRDRLRRQAALATGAQQEGADRMLPAGEWTDDRLAAAFLGGDSGPDPPIAARLRWIVDPVGERRRRVERSIAAIETAREASG